MAITGSLDWNRKRDTLLAQIQSLPYNPDLRRMLSNIDGMVKNLSLAEIEARRTKNKTKMESRLAEVNDAIHTLEKWIIMGQLLN